MTTPKAATPAPRSFPAVFWTANVMELFERAAYYGMNSVLAIYLSNSTDRGGLGFSEESIGFLQGLIYALTYVVPIVGGALADRYGYRRMLLVAFSLLASGYYLSWHMSAYGAVFLSLLVIELYQSLVDYWELYDNSAKSPEFLKAGARE